MRISQLENKDYLGNNGVGEYSYLIINYDTDAAPANIEEEADINPPVTYKVKLNELGKGIIKNLNIVQYGNNRLLKTLNGGETAYSDSTVGYFMDANDKNAIDSAVTAVTYDTTNKKFTRAIRNGTAADVVTTAQILTDMDLNVSNISGFGAGKTLSALSESGGKISASFQPIEIAQSQVTDLTTALGNKLETSLKGANNGLAELDASGRVPSSQLPSYVDDIIEGYFYNNAFYEEAAHTNAITGESGKIYVDLGGGRAIYRYSGSAFVEIPASPISDVQINGASIINNSVATVPLASDSTYGVVRTAGPSYGLEYSSAASGNLLRISPASSVNIKQGNAGYRAITPDNQHESVFYGLAKAAGDSTQAASENAVGTYTTDAQGAIRTMIGAGTYSKPSGGIPAADLAETYLTQHQSLSGLAPTESPEFTTQITIGNTTLTEAQLQALIAMIPENEEPQGG